MPSDESHDRHAEDEDLYIVEDSDARALSHHRTVDGAQKALDATPMGTAITVVRLRR